MRLTDVGSDEHAMEGRPVKANVFERPEVSNGVPRFVSGHQPQAVCIWRVWRSQCEAAILGFLLNGSSGGALTRLTVSTSPSPWSYVVLRRAIAPIAGFLAVSGKSRG
jgi:hypothetical protein